MIASRALGVVGEGAGLTGVSSRENRKRGFLERLSTGNSMKGFAKKGSGEMEQ